MEYAFNNSRTQKAAWVMTLAQQRVEGELLKSCGYWRNTGKKKSAGRAFYFNPRMTWTGAGFPNSLCQLQYSIFEWMDKEEAEMWPELFFSAIPVGADLSKICDEFLAWILGDPDQGMAGLAAKDGFNAESNLLLEVASLFREGNVNQSKLTAISPRFGESRERFENEGRLMRTLRKTGVLPSTGQVIEALRAGGWATEPDHYWHINAVVESAADAACTKGGVLLKDEIPKHRFVLSKQLLALLRAAPVPALAGSV